MWHAACAPRRPGSRRVEESSREVLGRAVTRGILAGLIAGIPQVLVTQIETAAFGLPREQADIGPRFVRRLAQRVMGESLSEPMHWLLATLFPLRLCCAVGGALRCPPGVAPDTAAHGRTDAGVVDLHPGVLAVGRCHPDRDGAPPERRSNRETLLHWTAALSFSLTTAYVYPGCARARRAR